MLRWWRTRKMRWAVRHRATIGPIASISFRRTRQLVRILAAPRTYPYDPQFFAKLLSAHDDADQG